MNIHHLVKMANEIGGFFESTPDHEEGLNSIAQHLRNFWDPRMRRQLIEYARNDLGDLKPNVREAVLRLDLGSRSV
jgi:formate dehydrogenase subunit delta